MRQCQARLRRGGGPCPRPALVGEEYCARHARRRADGGGAGEFYAPALAGAERGDLAAAAGLAGLAGEIAMLRLLIRRGVEEGDVEAARRGVETLCRALKVQRALEERPADSLAGAFARVLDEIGNELGVRL